MNRSLGISVSSWEVIIKACSLNNTLKFKNIKNLQKWCYKLLTYYCCAGIVSSFMSLSAAWGFGVPLSPSLFILVLFHLALLHFPFGFSQEEKGFKPKCSWENPKGRRQKAKRKRKRMQKKSTRKSRKEA